MMLHNSKHGQDAREVDIKLLRSAREVREALAITQCIEDPDILNIVEMFEEVTRGTENASNNYSRSKYTD